MAGARVAVAVTRHGDLGIVLLVFDHRDHVRVPTQVPAGGMVRGVTVSNAVRHEGREEAGADTIARRTVLGVRRSPHPVIGDERVTAGRTGITRCAGTTMRTTVSSSRASSSRSDERTNSSAMTTVRTAD
ncbi:hypothetical protein J4H86_11440 [Spiractinospora alimapuensis]|uniref:NUDIX domain-containing protein n=1 Tax=Spiractinospora alimapuensis TaxID=2820884 RepID=UPI001F3E34AD|nr:NUDIX hydrolase [Spiractinospora alimapuensis]QVQ54239.1 hypothetical protein J4H86_11440 [Spiractinospora alimapuensis]